ncbi:DsrE family protein [Alkalilimnicola ehrlichii MLHE-1]|uniref:DsrE family protein n=1 Tax=Alkalilimnicola ehrlichii (strain ATCC BAA-1101 / DSM 17681 / MLHE-1) TaxID=187272 RepID=Q0A9T0_ALKEH|nr:DsrE family protein [Alkalilimnicola ehrlichii]ABI56407.1 hypothetical protein Mlg_1055 [Alkalilimnicola ehrlichii MLHE-1]
MRIVPTLIVAAVALLSMGTAAAQATDVDVKRMILSVNSSSSLSQGLAMDIGQQLHDRGEEVRIVLCGSGAALARKGYDGPTLPDRDQTSQSLMQDLMGKGIRVDICEYALTGTEDPAEELIGGIGVTDPSELREFWQGATRIAAF